MKTKLKLIAICYLLTSICLSAFAQGTAFTYQGRLNSGGNPANGTYDFRFKLFEDSFGNTQAGSTVLTNGIPLTNGLFTVTIDFGAGIFNGSNYWLEVDVRTNNGGSYADLNPLQAVTPTPYAIFANTASNVSGTITSANLSGTYGGPVAFNNGGNSFSGSFTGNGANVTNVNAATLDGLGAANFWKTTGNAGTTAGVNFVGTTDNQPLELHVNGRRVVRLEHAPEDKADISNAVNVIQGSSANAVGPDVHGATIGGGGADFYFGGDVENMVASDYGTTGGGVGNQILTNAYESTIAGGNANVIYPGAYRATVAGGWYNLIETNANHASIGGGFNNTTLGSYDAIGGGHYNVTGNTNYDAPEATVAGGAANTASGISSFIGGGAYNLAYNNNAVVAGGLQNRAGYHAFVGSGYQNSADGGEATIGGGRLNSIDTNSFDSAIGGGDLNYISGTGQYSFIGGGAYNTNASYQGAIGGGQHNVMSNYWATIGGGADNNANGNYATVGGGIFNNVSTNFGAVAGGGANTASGSAAFIGGGGIEDAGNGSFYIYGNTASGAASVIGGGLANNVSGAGSFVGGGGFDGTSVTGNAVHANAATIGGGLGNSISSGATYAFIGGGSQNQISTPAANTVIAGGTGNQILTGNFSTIGGGAGNTNVASFATIPGGVNNTAGANAFAAGSGAQAVNQGAFVWADASAGNITSTNNNSVTMRAAGGFQFYTSAAGRAGAGVYLSPGGNSWISISDRNAKKDFAPVDGQAVLDKLARVPIEQWHYKWESSGDTLNIGPMAQDFIAAFYTGRDDKGISTMEFDGVELAAIQGLNQKLEEKAATIADQNVRIRTQAAEIEELKQSVAQLQTAVAQLTEGRAK